jgi:hypothetical protein
VDNKKFIARVILAMKLQKRIQGLLLAGLISVSTVSASFAAPEPASENVTTNAAEATTQNVTQDGSNAKVKVNGTIQNKSGQLGGKVSVIVPTQIAFTVLANGTFVGTSMTVTNNGDTRIKLVIESFNVLEAAGVSLKTLNEMPSTLAAVKPRSFVCLILRSTSTEENGSTVSGGCDLANTALINQKLRFATVGAGGGTCTIDLTGHAGKAAAPDIDVSGAEPRYEIVFKVSREA